MRSPIDSIEDSPSPLSAALSYRSLLVATLLSACSDVVSTPVATDAGFQTEGIPLFTCTAHRALEDGGQEEVLGIRPLFDRQDGINCQPVPQAPLQCPHFVDNNGTLWITNYPIEQATARFWPPDCPGIFTLRHQDACRVWQLQYFPQPAGVSNNMAQITSVVDRTNSRRGHPCGGQPNPAPILTDSAVTVTPIDRSTTPSLIDLIDFGDDAGITPDAGN